MEVLNDQFQGEAHAMLRSCSVLTEEQLAHYEQEGYLIVRGLFTQGEVQDIKETFDALREYFGTK